MVRSPITGSLNTEEILKLDSSRIKTQYAEIGVDVSRFINGKKISIYECKDTGYRFYYPFDIFGDGAFYEDLQKNLPWYYKEEKYEHQVCLKNIKPGQRVLEIGCGSGYFLELCREKGIEAEGLEFNDKAIEICRSKGLKVAKRSIQEQAGISDNKYDVVCFFQVLEHVWEVNSFLDSCIKLLKDNGMLMIGVPNNNPFIYKRDVYHTLNLPPHHSGLWNKASFENLSKYFNIQLENLIIERLNEYKAWYLAQKSHFELEKRFVGIFLGLVPRPLYKLALKLFRNFLQGRNIIAIYRKINH